MLALYLINNNFYIIDIKKNNIIKKFNSINQALNFLILNYSQNEKEAVKNQVEDNINDEEKDFLDSKLKDIKNFIKKSKKIKKFDFKNNYFLKIVYDDQNKLKELKVADINQYITKNYLDININDLNYVDLVEEIKKHNLTKKLQKNSKTKSKATFRQEKKGTHTYKLTIPFIVAFSIFMIMFVLTQILFFTFYIKKVPIKFESEYINIMYDYNWNDKEKVTWPNDSNNLNIIYKNKNEKVFVGYNKKIIGLRCTNIEDYNNLINLIIDNKNNFVIFQLRDFDSEIKSIKLNFEAVNSIGKKDFIINMHDNRKEISNNNTITDIQFNLQERKIKKEVLVDYESRDLRVKFIDNKLLLSEALDFNFSPNKWIISLKNGFNIEFQDSKICIFGNNTKFVCIKISLVI